MGTGKPSSVGGLCIPTNQARKFWYCALVLEKANMFGSEKASVEARANTAARGVRGLF